MKKLLCLLLTLIIITTISACRNYISEPLPYQSPEASIYAGNIQIAVTETEDAHPFQAMFSSPGFAINYVPIGETINIDLGGYLNRMIGVAEASLTAILLDDNGNALFSQDATQNISLTNTDSGVSFVLEPFTAAFLSAHTNDYIFGEVNQGFLLNIHVLDHALGYPRYSFAFAIRTDVIISDEEPVEPIELAEPGLITMQTTANTSGLNIAWENTSLMFPGDSNARLAIYADAELDENGHLMLDDRHEWAVVLHTAQGSFTLLPRRHLAVGNVSAVAFMNYDTEAYNVQITVAHTAGYAVYSYIFEEYANEFVRTTLFEADNINMIANSIGW